MSEVSHSFCSVIVDGVQEVTPDYFSLADIVMSQLLAANHATSLSQSTILSQQHYSSYPEGITNEKAATVDIKMIHCMNDIEDSNSLYSDSQSPILEVDSPSTWMSTDTVSTEQLSDQESDKDFFSDEENDYELDRVKVDYEMIKCEKGNSTDCTSGSATPQRQQHHLRSVSFSRFVQIAYTHAPLDYDRHSTNMAQLTSREYYEFMHFKAHMAYEMSREQQKRFSMEVRKHEQTMVDISLMESNDNSLEGIVPFDM